MSSSLVPLREDPVTGPRLAAKAGAASPLASGDRPPSAGAWKREMERAQLDSWFKPRQAASGDAGRPAGAAGQTALDARRPQLAPPKNGMKGSRAPAPGVTVGPAADRVPVMQASTPTAGYTLKFETGRMGAVDIRLGGLALALASVSRLKVTGFTPGSADPAEVSAQELDAPDALNTGSEESGPDKRGIRLHAEWHGQDVSVWLGIDARNEPGTQQEQLAQLLPHIRDCLQAQRSRLVKLICNGKTVFDVSFSFLPAFPYLTQPKESP